MLYGRTSEKYIRKLEEVKKYYTGESSEVIEEEMIMAPLLKSLVKELGKKKRVGIPNPNPNPNPNPKEIDVMPKKEIAEKLIYIMDFKNYHWECHAINIEPSHTL